ncbi:4'-phosphopantetheinyl transferase family protein [Sphingobacterium kitahiroshimense]|uniref:4'-phosphopantetheinyl transferase superfamily protein n=1 Tax=Sphingobacterium kitahiroshimense TaxID=470446 RepID=A0ABV0BUS4_9SPHI
MIRYSYFRCEYPLKENVFFNLLEKIPPSFRTKILKFKRWEDRYTSLMGKILLRHLLISIGYSDDCLQKLTIGEYGKPFIDGNVDFNISHSDGFVVCAISDSSNIGVDTEKIVEFDINSVLDILRQDEKEKLLRNFSLDIFYDFWTKKESVIKAMGRGVYFGDVGPVVSASTGQLFR